MQVCRAWASHLSTTQGAAGWLLHGVCHGDLRAALHAAGRCSRADRRVALVTHLLEHFVPAGTPAPKRAAMVRAAAGGAAAAGHWDVVQHLSCLTSGACAGNGSCCGKGGDAGARVLQAAAFAAGGAAQDAAGKVRHLLAVVVQGRTARQLRVLATCALLGAAVHGTAAALGEVYAVCCQVSSLSAASHYLALEAAAAVGRADTLEVCLCVCR